MSTIVGSQSWIRVLRVRETHWSWLWEIRLILNNTFPAANVSITAKHKDS